MGADGTFAPNSHLLPPLLPDSAAGCTSQTEQCMEFADGIKLARIVQAVSHMRGSIGGIEYHPKVPERVCVVCATNPAVL